MRGPYFDINANGAALLKGPLIVETWCLLVELWYIKSGEFIGKQNITVFFEWGGEESALY